MQRREDNVAARLNGNALQPLSDVAITVTDDKTGLPASLYSDNGVTPLAQPLKTDFNGYYGYYAANGEYTETFTSPRIETQVRKVVLQDPDDNPHATKAELAAGAGSSLVTFTQAGAGAVPRTVQAKQRETISVTDFGAVGDGVTSDAYAFQKALTYAHSIGGARVMVPTPAVAWLLDYPVFLRDDTDLIGTGAGCKVIYKNPLYAKGRGGFVIGSSLEANRDTALAAYAAGTYPGASTRNNTYVNPAAKQYLRDNPQFTEARNSTIRGFYIVAQFDNPTDWGGYAVNLVNAWNCHVSDIWGEGWTQLIGMGSDVAPETPSNHLCTATNLHVVKPDPVHTYYAVGFIANSTDCEISRARQHASVTNASADGNGVAVALVESCVLKDIRIPNLGRSSNSQGLLLNNAKGCFVDDIYIGNAKTAVATYYLDASFNDAAMPNVFGQNIVGDTCDTVISLGAKRARILGFKNVNCTYDLSFLNLNATNNEVLQVAEAIYTPSDQARRLYFANNTLAGWRQRIIYIRPFDWVANEKNIAVLAWDTNKGVEAKSTTALQFRWRVPAGVRAIDAVRAYVTYKDNAQAGGTNCKIDIRRMVGFNGNTSEAPYSEAALTDAATNTTSLDKLIDMNGVFVETASTAHGLAGSVDVLLSLNSPTVGSVVKETKITYYGD